jgi:hypothetical protein
VDDGLQVLAERSHTGTRDFEPAIDRIGEIFRVTKHVSGCIRCSKGRKQRMTVAQAHSLASYAAIVGAVWSSTIRKRSPSATNRMILWGRGIDGSATAAHATELEKIASTMKSTGGMEQGPIRRLALIYSTLAEASLFASTARRPKTVALS